MLILTLLSRLQAYLDQEKRVVQMNKRQKLVEEEDKRVREVEAKQREEDEEKRKRGEYVYTRYVDRKYIPDVDRIDVTAEFI